MPAPRQRNRSLRKVKVRVPGGRNTTHYRKRKPAKAVCSACGKILKGVPRERPYKMRKMGKTEKRPERPFGGNLCSECSRKRMIEKARGSK